MSTIHQRGEMNILLVPLILAVLMLLGTLGFGAWAFSERQTYKDNADQKIAEAVETAKLEQSSVKDKEFAEKEKHPLKTYAGPSAYGSVTVAYPKTWSGYVMSGQASSNPVDGYFHPGVVPGVNTLGAAFALRVQVSTQPYSTIVESYNSYIKLGKVTATPFSYPKVPGVVGVRLDGEINPGMQMQGSMVIVPLRDKTFKVWTESPEFRADFNNNVIPYVTFSP